MKITKRIGFTAALVLLGTFANVAGASMITTTTWAPDLVPDGLGAGMLNGVTVTYSTIADAARYAGETVVSPNSDWNAIFGTVCPCSDVSGGVFGTESLAALENIHFSSPVLNPILFISDGDAGSSMNFGSTVLTFLSSNNAQLTGSVVTFVGANNTAIDGFAARLNGTFTDINFTYSFQGAGVNGGYTSAVFSLSEAPEPASLALAFSGVFGLWIYRRRNLARR